MAGPHVAHPPPLRRSSRRLLLLTAGILLLCSRSPAQDDAAAEPAAPALRVLLLGNSYTEHNKLPMALAALAGSARVPVRLEVESRTPGGYTFEKHRIEGSSVDLIRAGGWDVVVLQEQSERPLGDPLSMLRYGRELIEEVRRAGARPLLFMTWASAGRPESIDAIAAAYRGLGEQCGAEVAPVGLAWRDALAADPDLLLHQADGSHPTPAGSYLAACVLLGWIADLDPRSLGDDTARRALVPAEISALKGIALAHLPARAALPMARDLRVASSGRDRIALRWERADVRPEAIVVERGSAADAGAAFERVAELAGSATRFTDSGLEPGRVYFYRVWTVGAARGVDLPRDEARTLRLPWPGHGRVELRALEGAVRWTLPGGEELELAAGESALREPDAGPGEFVAIVQRGAGAGAPCRAEARALPSAAALAAIPPLEATTKD